MKNSIKILFLFFLVFNLSCDKIENDPLLNAENEQAIALKAKKDKKPKKNAKIVNNRLGLGFNLGGQFAGYKPIEQYKEIIDKYREAGFKHVRIPTRWVGDGLFADWNGNVDFENPRFLKLVEVIDYAISKKMYVVLNTHHERWLNSYNGTWHVPIFNNLWTDIATYFKDRSQFLIFDILNEPTGQFGNWNPWTPRPDSELAINNTREINEIGYNAIRNAGGQNDTRVIMFEPNNQGHHNAFTTVYPDASTFPGGGDDPFIIAHVHTYDPWNFCGQQGYNSNYKGRWDIMNRIRQSSTAIKALGIPVNYGEFGVGRDPRIRDYEERGADVVKEYYKTFADATEELEISATAWDDQGWFALTKTNEDGSIYFVYDIAPYMASDLND